MRVFTPANNCVNTYVNTYGLFLFIYFPLVDLRLTSAKYT